MICSLQQIHHVLYSFGCSNVVKGGEERRIVQHIFTELKKYMFINFISVSPNTLLPKKKKSSFSNLYHTSYTLCVFIAYIHHLQSLSCENNSCNQCEPHFGILSSCNEVVLTYFYLGIRYEGCIIPSKAQGNYGRPQSAPCKKSALYTSRREVC